MQTCIKCDALLPEGAIYCPTCGKKQTAQPSKKHVHRRNRWLSFDGHSPLFRA